VTIPALDNLAPEKQRRHNADLGNSGLHPKSCGPFFRGGYTITSFSQFAAARSEIRCRLTLPRNIYYPASAKAQDGGEAAMAVPRLGVGVHCQIKPCPQIRRPKEL
jgi:hypothetical protein